MTGADGHCRNALYRPSGVEDKGDTPIHELPADRAVLLALRRYYVGTAAALQSR